MHYYLSHYRMSAPVILGPLGSGQDAYILRKDGTYSSAQYHGHIYKTQSLCIPLSRFVKVKVEGKCTEMGRDIQPIGEGWHLVGLYVGGHWPGVFLVCDEGGPIEKFCPPGPAPGRL